MGRPGKRACDTGHLVTADSDFQNVGCRDAYSADLAALNAPIRFTGLVGSRYSIDVAGPSQMPDHNVSDKGTPYGVQSLQETTDRQELTNAKMNRRETQQVESWPGSWLIEMRWTR